MDIEFRSYKTGDSFRFAAMLSGLPYKRDTAYWTWMYRLLNTTDPVISLAVVKQNGIEKIVGYTAAAVKTISIGNEEFYCGHGFHTFVDPQYRKYEYIAYELGTILHNNCSHLGVKFILGFPNGYMRDILLQQPSAIAIKLFNALEYTYGKVPGEINGTSLEENSFPDVFEALHRIMILKEENRSSLIHINKTVQYYYFRYFANPENTYQVKWIFRNKEILGVVFLKNYTNGDIKFGHLVEYIINSKSISHEEMVKLVMADFNGRVDKLAFWPVEKDFNDCLLRLGFEATGFDTMLTARFLDDEFQEKYAPTLGNFNNWNLQMGDSDAF